MNFGSEKGVGCRHVRGCLFAMGLHAGNLCFQKLDARVQFVSRIAVQAFLREAAGGVGARSRAIVVFHQMPSIGRCALAVNRRES